MNEGEYEILPHEEISHLRRELERVKGQSLLINHPDRELTKAMEELNSNVKKLYKLFEKAHKELHDDEKEDPLRKLEEQNRHIAKGIVALSRKFETQEKKIQKLQQMQEELTKWPTLDTTENTQAPPKFETQTQQPIQTDQGYKMPINIQNTEIYKHSPANQGGFGNYMQNQKITRPIPKPPQPRMDTMQQEMNTQQQNYNQPYQRGIQPNQNFAPPPKPYNPSVYTLDRETPPTPPQQDDYIQSNFPGYNQYKGQNYLQPSLDKPLNIEPRKKKKFGLF